MGSKPITCLIQMQMAPNHLHYLQIKCKKKKKLQKNDGSLYLIFTSIW